MMRSLQSSGHMSDSALAFTALGAARCRSLRDRQCARRLRGLPALSMNAFGVDVRVNQGVAGLSVRQSSAIWGTSAAVKSP